MAASTCILCGTKGPLTREHIWPDWYSRLHRGRDYVAESIIGDKPPRYRQARSLDLQPRVLCASCNNDWGGNLEEAVRPRLSHMADGQQEMVTLPFGRQLSAWATLKMMAAEHLVRSDPEYATFFTQEQGLYLRDKTKPPEFVVLSMGHYVGRFRDAGWVLTKRSARELPEDPTVGAFRFSSSFSIGDVAFQLFGVRLFPLTEGRASRNISFYNPYSVQASPPWSDALFRIWPLPASRFLWPPPKALDDRGFDAAAARWHEQKLPRATS